MLDSAWFDYALPAVRPRPGALVEVRCTVPLELAPVVEVDTSGPVDIPQVAATATRLAEVIPRSARPGP